MIYIVHGEDTPKARTLIVNQQNKLGIKSKIEINLSEITPQEFQAIVSQGSLFGEKQLVIANVTSLGRTNPDKFIEILENTHKENSIVVFSEKSLPKSNKFLKAVNKLGARVIEVTQQPTSNIFKFIDSTFLKNRRASYQELNRLLSDDIDYFNIFSMMLYSLRNITYAKYKTASFEKLRPFQKSKFSRQADLYDENKIKKLFQEFYEIDRKTKTGELTPELMITTGIEKVLNS